MAERAIPQVDLFSESVDSTVSDDGLAEINRSSDIDPDDFFSNEPPLSAYSDELDSYPDDDFTSEYGEDYSVASEANSGGVGYSAPVASDFMLPGPPPGFMLEPFTLNDPAYPLDPQQELAASHGGGAALVIAGAGSGKTSVVIELTSRRLESGISPSGYIMLTFSRKAAAEMKTRLKERLGFESGIDPTTFHSFFFKLIAKAPERFGVNKDFSIMDDKDQRKVFEMVLDEHGIDRAEYPSVQWQRGYSFCKNECLRAGTSFEDMVKIVSHMREFLKVDDRPAGLTDKQIALTLFDYEQYTQSAGLLDYDDLILRPLEVFRENPEIVKEYARQVKYLIVDESQDTNLAQYALIQFIGLENGNVVMVGDDDQSIYGWRGAHPENLSRFIKDFGAKQYLIESNYRCAPEIVKKATAQVRINQDRLEKNPKSMANQGTQGEVNLVTAGDSYSMSKNLIGRIKRAISTGVKPSDIAILYRTNRMLTEIEGDLIKEGVPYHVAGSSKMMDKKETKLCIAVARLVINNHDGPALWLVREMLDGVGVKAVSRLIAHASETGKPLLSDDGINMVGLKKAREALLDFRSIINHLRRATPNEWISVIRERMSPLKPFKAEMNSNPATYRRREACIDQLESWSKNLNCDNWHKLFEILLEQEDPEQKNNKEQVTVSTIHKAKGLEWDHVHFVGFSRGLFPMERFSEGEDDVTSRNDEEERRLSYVLMTRAKKHCYFYHSTTYKTDPKRSFSLSGFAKEIHFNNHHKVEKSFQQNNNHAYGRNKQHTSSGSSKQGGTWKSATAKKSFGR